MNSRSRFKNYLIELICLLYILLFVYAAISKLLDFENFQVQLGQSPLLSAFAFWISWIVPVIELVTAVLLLVPKYKNIGLSAAFSLMIMFTVYIYLMLHYSSFVPCSCGGILEKMSWNIHLVFNIIFAILAFIGLWLQSSFRTKKGVERKPFKFIWKITLNTVSSAGLIIILFLTSEKIIHHNNPFIRRYPQHPVMFDRTYDVKFNSYYFAGGNKKSIYLGNYTNPLNLISINPVTANMQKIEIAFDGKDIHFNRVKIAVRVPDFYLMDGTVPAAFMGKTNDWKIIQDIQGLPYFTIAEPLEDGTIILRSSNGQDASHTIGLFDKNKSPKYHYNDTLLQKQREGIFSTDGMLVYSREYNSIIYTYYYRNGFTVADNNLELKYRGHTIDTNKTAKIKVAYLKNNTERKMSAPTLTVNAHSAVYKNLLFINSRVPGKLEDQILWDQAFIIDVYDLNKKSYLMSFAVYKIKGKKLRSIFITEDHFYALMDNELAVYKFRSILKKEIK